MTDANEKKTTTTSDSQAHLGGVNIELVRAAASRIAGQVQTTPCLKSQTLSDQLGCELYIKFENQQFTASFKERGALNKLLVQGATDALEGVIAMSAGNHAQALAYHGQRLGLQTTIVMPRSTPNAKVEATRVFGAEVILHGTTFDETLAYTEQLRDERGLHLIHPFDDAQVIAGQGTVGLEIAEQVDNIDTVVVPVGGGGLIAGIGCALAATSPSTKVVGVQMRRFPGAHHVFHNTSANDGGISKAQAKAQARRMASVAEGIAVKHPGDLTSAVMRQYVSDVQLVDEAMVEQAIFDLLEIEKTVAEGAGAAPLALLRNNRAAFAGQRVVMVLSGGNIDMMILSSVLQRGLVRSHRLARLQVEIPDTPGALAGLTTLLSDMDSNIVDIQHQRAFGGSSVRATLVEIVLQLRGEEQRETVVQALTEQGYEIHYS